MKHDDDPTDGWPQPSRQTIPDDLWNGAQWTAYVVAGDVNFGMRYRHFGDAVRHLRAMISREMILAHMQRREPTFRGSIEGPGGLLDWETIRPLFNEQLGRKAR